MCKEDVIGDADLDIVKKAVDVPTNVNAVVVGEGIDLRILLLYQAKNDKGRIFFCPEQKQNSNRRSKVWGIRLRQCVIGQNLHILFLHAFLGCDTMLVYLVLARVFQ